LSSIRLACALGLCALVPACSLLNSTCDLLFRDADELRERELQSVAKDWCLTLRASQVLPVYPLTEDLQPGDMFLVTRTVEDQADEYSERGFLSFDRFVGRLEHMDYAGFYAGSYGIGKLTDTPNHWRFPEPPRTTPPLTDWARAPAAFFPSYTFSVSKGSGAAVALPLQSVPLGLSLMSSQEATGSVVLTDARTYGLPLERLMTRLAVWSSRPENRQLLVAVRPRNDEGDATPAWLRVVARVYLVHGVDVALINTDDASLGLDLGSAPPEIRLLEQAATDPESYQAALETVNETLTGMASQAVSEAAAGAAALASPVSGSMRLAQASRRGIAARETFSRPLVIGYLGFDFPILRGGKLGVPVTTIATAEGTEPADSGELGVFTSDQQLMGDETATLEELSAMDPARVVQVYQRAAEIVGPGFLALYQAALGAEPATATSARNAFAIAVGQLPMQPESPITPAQAQALAASALQQARLDLAGAP
jgi:hypothetical protein